MATTVGIDVIAHLGTSTSQAKLFANDLAEIPIDVYVSLTPDEDTDPDDYPTVESVALANSELVTVMTYEDMDSAQTAYPATNFTADQRDNANYEGHPENTVTQFNPPGNSQKFTFYVRTKGITVSDTDAPKSFHIMAMALVKNYIPASGDAAETRVFFSNMVADNSAESQVKIESIVQVDAMFKPPVVIDWDMANTVDNAENTSHYPQNSKIYYYKGSFGKYTDIEFKLKSGAGNVTPDNGYIGNNGNYMTSIDQGMRSFHFKGDTSGQNNIARVIWHGEATNVNDDYIQIIDDQNSSKYPKYFIKVDQTMYASSMSYYAWTSVHIKNDDANQTWIKDGQLQFWIKDVWGGSTKKVVTADSDVSGDGNTECWITHSDDVIEHY